VFACYKTTLAAKSLLLTSLVTSKQAEPSMEGKALEINMKISKISKGTGNAMRTNAILFTMSSLFEEVLQ
jgi:hypothetical protein